MLMISLLLFSCEDSSQNNEETKLLDENEDDIISELYLKCTNVDKVLQWTVVKHWKFDFKTKNAQIKQQIFGRDAEIDLSKEGIKADYIITNTNSISDITVFRDIGLSEKEKQKFRDDGISEEMLNDPYYNEVIINFKQDLDLKWFEENLMRNEVYDPEIGDLKTVYETEISNCVDISFDEYEKIRSKYME